MQCTNYFIICKQVIHNKYLGMTIGVFDKDELYIFKKIWIDLSERTGLLGINKESFLMYIPINGLLGDRLFHYFDKGNTGFISWDNFICSLTILCLGTINEQVRLLFELFNISDTEYISRQDLITMLNYVPKNIFCTCNGLNNSEKCDMLELYTNKTYCECAFTKDHISYGDFSKWIKQIPGLLAYIKNTIPLYDKSEFIDKTDKTDKNYGSLTKVKSFTNLFSHEEAERHSDRIVLWKIGEKTGAMIKRYFIIKDNCLYYYNSNTLRPKGLIFLEGSMITSNHDKYMEEKGYFGFDIVHRTSTGEYHHHDKRTLFSVDNQERISLIHKLQHASHIVPFEDDYQLLHQIGQGAFSIVYKCENKETNDNYAVKIINKEIFKTIDKQLINNEIAILKLVHHPNIITLIDTYEDNDNMYIVTELIEDGDFFDHIVSKPCYTEQELYMVAKQLLESIAYLHEFGIVHCDIKPENILYDKRAGNIIKLTDFGLSKMIYSNETINSACGTISYVAPEVLLSAGYGKAADIWSIGIICYLLTMGKLPYASENYELILQEMNETQLTFKSNLSNDFVDFINNLLNVDPIKRITAVNALHHPYIINNSNKKLCT